MNIALSILLTTMNAAERLADPEFGSYMLNGLREIILPPPPSYRPQTIGWAILGGIALIALTLWSIQQYRRWHRNRYRRAALHRLTELEQLAQQSTTRVAALRELSELLKRTALAAYPREQVAPLYGDDWLTFLDRTYNGNGFAQGDGRMLAQLPYQPAETIAQLSPETFTGLIATVRQWIIAHPYRRD
jgi:hypothetical protein